MKRIGKMFQLAGGIVVLAMPATAMVEYTQMATDAAELAGCSVVSINESGQAENGDLTYEVQCEGGATAQVTCAPGGCTYGAMAAGDDTETSTSKAKRN